MRRSMKMASHFNYLSLPPGYRFCPSDVDLVVHYLRKKVLHQQLPTNLIPEVQLYDHDPEYLTEKYPPCGDKTWYFFTSRDRKHKNGTRPNRVAGNGYWKASVGDKPIRCNGHHIGDKKVLVFHRGKPSKNDEKTNWIMHEFRVIEGRSTQQTSRGPNDMKLDDWVLCKVYKKVYKSRQDTRDDADTSMGNDDHLDGFDDDTGSANAPNNLDLCSKNEVDAHMGLVNSIGTSQVHNIEGSREDADTSIGNGDHVDGFDDDTGPANAPNNLGLSSENEMDVHMGLINSIGATQVHHVEGSRDDADTLKGNGDHLHGFDADTGPASAPNNLDLSSNYNEMDADMGLINPISDAEFNQFLQYDLPVGITIDYDETLDDFFILF